MLVSHTATPLGVLQHINIFNDLDEQLLELLAQNSRLIELQTKKDIPEEFAMKDKVYVLAEGKAFLSCIDQNGKKIILETLKEGSFFGDLEIEEKVKPDNHCLFIEPFPKTSTRICEFEKDKFLEIIADNPTLALRVVSELSKRVTNLEEKIEELTFYSLETRLLVELIKMGEYEENNNKGTVKVKFKITHEKLAQATGAVRETVSKALTKLKSKGYIFYDNNKNLIVKLIRRKRTDEPSDNNDKITENPSIS